MTVDPRREPLRPAWTRLLPLVLAGALTGATWLGPEGAAHTAGTDRGIAMGGERLVAADVHAAVPPPPPPAAPPSASPTPAPSHPPVAPSVIVHRPDVLIEPGDASTAALAVVSARDDVDHVAGGVRFDARLDRFGEASDHEAAVPDDEPLSALAIDPVSFRPLAPEVTAQVPAVWEQLLDGHAVMSHEAALKRGIRLGDQIRLVTDRGERQLRVGALAANGVPAIADLLVPLAAAEPLVEPTWNLLIVAASEGTGPVWLGEQIVASIGGGSFARLDAPRPSSRVSGWGQLETFRYVDLPGGRIRILDDWVPRFIVAVDLPILGRARCNRLMVPQLVGALNEIESSGLADLIDPAQFGGCFVPRHVDWDPNKPISMHAWGLAIDINVASNELGRPPTMDRRIVAIFRRWGFWWGGWWSRPDGMHFQVNQFVSPD